VKAEDRRRPFVDKLVWSSSVYAIAGAYSISVGQHAIGLLQILT
jgi:hypothetical protein